jgi:hypothetical protein
MRWEHEGLLEEMQVQLDRAPDMMCIRRQTVEHPFGTIKVWMGATHFLTRTLERVKTEMSLHVLAYNIKRVIKLFGSETVKGAAGVKRARRTGFCNKFGSDVTFVAAIDKPRSAIKKACRRIPSG